MKMNLFSKKVLPMTLAAVMAVAPVQVMAAPASDIAGHWAEAVITEWQEQGLIKGYEDGTFKPGNNITRAEFVTIMNNALGYEDAAALDFTDVAAGNWYYSAVAKAVAAGYVSGYEDGTFKPNNTITRAEAAVMIANAMGLGDRGSVADDFTDAADIPGWAKGSIGAIVEAQYMSGYPDGSFGARKSITRAEAVSALNRVLMGGYSDDMVVTEDDTVVEGGVVAGDLIIDEKVGEGEVYLNDVEVMGDLIVNGGGEDSVYLKNVKVHGKAHVNKSGVRLQMQGKTDLPKVEMNAPAKLDADKTFEGKIGEVKIAKDLGTTNKVTINVPVVKLVVDAKANIVINVNIETVEIGEGAEGVRVEIAKGIKVLKMIIDAIATLAGAGTIEALEVNVDGVTVNKNLTVEDMDVADGVKAPATVTETTTGGGGSSSSGGTINKDKKYDITIDCGEGGTVTADKAKAEKGEEVTLTVTTSGEEYKLALLAVNSEEVTAKVVDGKYTFAMPKEDVVVTANFEKITGEENKPGTESTPAEFTVTVDTAIENGTVTYTVNKDGTVTLTATPAEGYELVEVTVNGVVVTEYTFALTENITVSAKFEEIKTEPTVRIISGLKINVAKVPTSTTSGVEFATSGVEFTVTGAEFTFTFEDGEFTADNVTLTAEYATVSTTASEFTFTIKAETATADFAFAETLTAALADACEYAIELGKPVVENGIATIEATMKMIKK